MERYVCCQGTATTEVGKKHATSCPRLCNFLESFFCMPCSVGGSRAVVQTLKDLQDDPCDNRIQRFNNCCADGNLCCQVCTQSMNTKSKKEVLSKLDKQNKLNICGRAAYMFVIPCMLVQTWLEMKYRSTAKTTLAEPVTVHTRHPVNAHKAWQSPSSAHYQRPKFCTCGYEQPPRVAVVSQQPNRYWNNKVHPVEITDSHPLAKHLQNLSSSPQKEQMYDDEADNIRALWSTSRINQATGTRHADGYEYDSDASSSLHLQPRHGSPAHYRARLTPIDQSSSRGKKKAIPPRFNLNTTADMTQVDAASPATQYNILQAQRNALERGKELMEGKATANYKSTVESLDHGTKERYSAGRVVRSKERRQGEIDEAEREKRAAIKIQAQFRGHAVRRRNSLASLSGFGGARNTSDSEDENSLTQSGSFRSGMIRPGQERPAGAPSKKEETNEELERRLTRELQEKIAKDQARVAELEGILKDKDREEKKAEAKKAKRAKREQQAREKEAITAALAAQHTEREERSRRPSYSKEELSAAMKNSSFKSKKPVLWNPRPIEAQGSIGISGDGDRAKRAKDDYMKYTQGQAL